MKKFGPTNLRRLGGSFHRGPVQPGKVKAPGTSASGVPLSAVSMQTAPQIAQAVGTVQPQFKTMVYPRVIANTVELPVAAGQHVREGNLPVRLDDRHWCTRRQQAQEALRRTEATQGRAQSDFEREKGQFDLRCPASSHAGSSQSPGIGSGLAISAGAFIEAASAGTSSHLRTSGSARRIASSPTRINSPARLKSS